MSYKLIPASENGFEQRVILQRSRTGQFIFGAIFFLIGLGVFLPGLLVSLADKTAASGGLMLLGFGLTFMSAGCMILFMFKLPNRFIFDNERGAFLIEEKGTGPKPSTTTLPYSEIEDLEIREQVDSSGEGSSTTYCVSVVKKDGALWSIYESGSEKKSEKVLDELLRRVDLSRPSHSTAPLTPGETFKESEKSGRSFILWKLRGKLRSGLLFLLILGGFGTIVYAARAQMNPTVWLVVGGLLALISLAVALDTLTSINAHGIVEISQDKLRTYRQGGIFKGKTVEMPIHEISAILFHFRSNKIDPYLYCLREKERELHEQQERGELNLSDLKNIMLMMMKVTRIDATGLTMGEKYYLESRLQELILQRSGHIAE